MDSMWTKLIFVLSVLVAKEVLAQDMDLPHYITELVKDIKQLKGTLRGVTLDRNTLSDFLDGDEAIRDRQTLEAIKSYLKGKVASQGRKKRSAENEELEHREKRAIMNFNNQYLASGKWPNGRIFYALNQTLTASQKAVIYEAVNWWETKTCVTFTEVFQNQRPTQPYVLFTPGAGCVSFVGRTIENVPQPTYLDANCFELPGRVAHEIGHTLGFWHTHQLSTRDDYITVFPERMAVQNDGEIVDLPASLINYYNLPYDFASILHYDPRIFANPGLRTIETRDPLFQQTIGQRSEISFQDAKVANLEYCGSTCRNIRVSCQNGGYQHPGNCGRCICPDGWSGSLCTTVDRRRCGGDILVDGRGGSISSPGFDRGEEYPKGILCAWRLRNNVNQNIVFEFDQRFGIYCYGDTAFHWVELRINGTLHDTGYRFCGTQRPRNVFVSVNPSKEVMVVFKSPFDSPSSFRRTGFKLSYQLENQFGCMVSGCQNGGTCNAANGMCQCAQGYRGISCEVDSRCSQGYCQNGATCATRPNRAPLCTCRPGFNGVRCQNVNPSSPNPTPNPTPSPTRDPDGCGGCGLDGGSVQIACNSTTETAEYQVRCDNVDMRRFRFFGGRGGSRGSSSQFCTVTLPKKYCCPNAELMRMQDGFYCGVRGWSNWGPCGGGTCGGCGMSRRNLYQIRRYDYPRTCRDDSMIICGTDERGCNFDPCPIGQCIGRNREDSSEEDDSGWHSWASGLDDLFSWLGRRRKRGASHRARNRDGLCVNQCCVPFSLSSDGSTCSDGSNPPDMDPRQRNPVTPSTTTQREFEPIIYAGSTVPENMANRWNPWMTPSTRPPRNNGQTTIPPNIRNPHY